MEFVLFCSSRKAKSLVCCCPWGLLADLNAGDINDQVIKRHDSEYQETQQHQLQRQPNAMINLQQTLLHYVILLY